MYLSADESQGETVLGELFGKHGTPESQELGKDQFVALLRDLLVYLGDFLAKNPVLKVHPGLNPNSWTKSDVLEKVSCLSCLPSSAVAGLVRCFGLNPCCRLECTWYFHRLSFGP